MTIEFTIPGAPQGKERPRFDAAGVVYTPAKTRKYERLVAWAYQAESHGRRLAGAVTANIAAVYPIPKSWSLRKHQQAERGELIPLVKPDLDNVAKAVLDALNGIAYKDDSAVTSLIIRKHYGLKPCVLVRLSGEEAPRESV